MHELSIAQSILDVAVSHAELAGAHRITGINLVIGQLTSAVDDSIQFYWDVIAEGTLAQGARLHFNRIPAMLRCGDCGAVFAPTTDSFDCPTCHSRTVGVCSGDELRVESLEVE
jgi:hydrogenase nickel incorporation protein HypA/HybF